MQRVAGKPDDAEEARQAFLCALLGPIERRALRVRVDDDDALALGSPGSRYMQRQCRLADAALLVEERDDHCASPRAERLQGEGFLRSSVRFAPVGEPRATQEPKLRLQDCVFVSVR